MHMKRLLVMRHAKSDWEAGVDDEQRPLNPRGTRQAAAMGHLLRDLGEVPEQALASSAVRARTTLELAIDAGGWRTHASVTDELYACSAAGALVVASEAAQSQSQSLLLVGHQPTWGELVARLTGGEVNMKTATVVGIDLPIATWQGLPTARGTIAFVLQAQHFDQQGH